MLLVVVVAVIVVTAGVAAVKIVVVFHGYASRSYYWQTKEKLAHLGLEC